MGTHMTEEQKKEARREAVRRYKATPKGQATQEASLARCRESLNARRRTPEYRAKERARRNTPEFRAKINAYHKTPEFRAKRKTWPTSIQRRLSGNLRRRVRHALAGKAKAQPTLELLGCSIEQLRTHIEAQWIGSMSWENYGSWHIDHIKPCASYDLTDEAQQRACFHYSNLQPLWAEDNLRKGATC